MDLKGFLLTTMIESCGVNPWSPSIDDRMDFLNDGGLSRLQCLAFLIVVNENQVLFSTGFITMGTTLVT